MNSKPTLEELNKIIERNGGSLDLSYTQITALPENLTVGGSLDLSYTQITALPDNLTVGGGLYLRHTQITALPDNLTVGGWLDLRGTQITALPDNLTVGGWLDLRGTQITNPDNYKKLNEGDYVPGRYLYCDEILTHVKRKRTFGKYTYYVGKIKGKNVISDGKFYAHCSDFKSGVADLEFKEAKDRGAEQYRSYTLDTVLTPPDAMTMYRIITGACRAGTQSFVDSLGKLKESYTVGEIIELTKGHYGAERFKSFFEEVRA